MAGISEVRSHQDIAYKIWEVFAVHPDMHAALGESLREILRRVDRASGAIQIKGPGDMDVLLLVSHQARPEWQAYAETIQQRVMGNFPREVEVLSQEGALELVVYPILSPGGQQGVLLVDGPQLAGDSQVEMLAALTALGLAIQSGRQQSMDAGFSRKFQGLESMFAGLKPNMSTDEIHNRLVSGIRDSFGCQCGAMVLMDATQNGLIVKKSLMAGQQDWIYQVSFGLGEGLLGRCMGSGRAILSNHPEQEEDFKEAVDAIPGVKADNLMYVPMKVENEVIGLIGLMNRKGGGFTLGDQVMLTSMAGLIANLTGQISQNQKLSVANADLEAQNWELIRSRNTLRSLFDNMLESFYIIDYKYHLIALNMARARRANREPRVLVGKHCYEVLYQRDEPCAGCMVRETFFNGKITHRIGREWITDGEALEWEVSTYPIIDEFEQVVQVIVFERDVTEKNRMEVILAQSEKLAAVGQLAAGIAHEINNPLTVVLANSQLLLRSLPKEDVDSQESVELIYKAGARAQYVVRNLLDFARKEQLDFVPTDINETIERALEMLRHEMLERDIRVDFKAGKNLPDIMLSPDHVQGVWLNIILNAMDATERGKGKVTVVTSKHEDELWVIISDNGQGIPQESLSRIFEPFYTTKEPGRGTGLGLSVCHRIIKQHGGHILVDSEKNKGTKFTVVLPIY